MNPTTPHATQPRGVGAAVDRHAERDRRGLVRGVCALVAIYVAFAVGTPWLLRDAPPDTYEVVAAKAACAETFDARLTCEAGR
jgi:hypothetical protein